MSSLYCTPQITNIFGDWESVCQDPIEDFEVYFTHSHTPQDAAWPPTMIYIAAHTANNADPASYQVSEVLTLHVETSKGNPIEYYIDWVGSGPSGSSTNPGTFQNVSIDGQ